MNPCSTPQLELDFARGPQNLTGSIQEGKGPPLKWDNSKIF